MFWKVQANDISIRSENICDLTSHSVSLIYISKIAFCKPHFSADCQPGSIVLI